MVPHGAWCICSLNQCGEAAVRTRHASAITTGQDLQLHRVLKVLVVVVTTSGKGSDGSVEDGVVADDGSMLRQLLGADRSEPFGR